MFNVIQNKLCSSIRKAAILIIIRSKFVSLQTVLLHKVSSFAISYILATVHATFMLLRSLEDVAPCGMSRSRNLADSLINVVRSSRNFSTYTYYRSLVFTSYTFYFI